MKKVKSILATTGIIFIVLFFIFAMIKGSLVVIWTSSDSITTYAINGGEGRSLKIIFLPENKTIMYYKDSSNGDEEYILTKMAGSYGTHYFWGLWKLDGPGIFYGSLLGYRIYSPDIEPVVMEIDTIQKTKRGGGDSNFPQIGKTTYTTFLFKNDSVKFEGMWLKKDKTNHEFVTRLLNDLKR